MRVGCPLSVTLVCACRLCGVRYDVVHVLRAVTNRTVKLEMARAYLQLVRVARGGGDDVGAVLSRVLGVVLREVAPVVSKPVDGE